MQISRAEAAYVILNRIKEIRKERGRCLVAIDGNSGSGKSTLAAQLAAASGATLFHMDDFFLPPQLRTEARLDTPGGNIDSERFVKEIIKGLEKGKTFSYRAFSCKNSSYIEKTAPHSTVNIFEGVYSMHPDWQAELNLKVFLQIPPEVQQDRILHRSGPEQLKKFTELWIPLENRYFEFYGIRESCDYIVTV
ncbi:MAG: uridine kinase [Clostridiales bacterium]|jgi:hypothetical protein|nr:uridine kinase [Clostridiales bacterium]